MRKKSKLIILITCLAFVLLGFVLLFRFMNSSSVGTVQNQDGLSKVKGASLTLKEQKTAYYTIQITDQLFLKTATIDEQRPIYAQYMYAGVDFASDLQLSISLGRQAQPSVNEISFVKQRKLEGGNYIVMSDSANRVVFRRADNTEYSIFSLNVDGYRAIVGSGMSDSYQEIKAIVDQAELSWR